MAVLCRVLRWVAPPNQNEPGVDEPTRFLNSPYQQSSLESRAPTYSTTGNHQPAGAQLLENSLDKPKSIFLLLGAYVLLCVWSALLYSLQELFTVCWRENAVYGDPWLLGCVGASWALEQCVSQNNEAACVLQILVMKAPYLRISCRQRSCRDLLLLDVCAAGHLPMLHSDCRWVCREGELQAPACTGLSQRFERDRPVRNLLPTMGAAYRSFEHLWSQSSTMQT